MKVILCDESHYEIFLNSFFSFSIDNKEKLEQELKQIFLKLESYYHINVNGFYHVTLYHDSNTGVVLEVEKEDMDYYPFSTHEIELRIQIEREHPFLYKLEDYYLLTPSLLKKGEVYYYQNAFYYFIKKPLKELEKIYLFEYSIIDYKDWKDILKAQNKIKKGN